MKVHTWSHTITHTHTYMYMCTCLCTSVHTRAWRQSHCFVEFAPLPLTSHGLIHHHMGKHSVPLTKLMLKSRCKVLGCKIIMWEKFAGFLYGLLPILDPLDQFTCGVLWCILGNHHDLSGLGIITPKLAFPQCVSPIMYNSTSYLKNFQKEP